MCGARGVQAYLTVEAACVMPIVLTLYLFIIYGMFYGHDRCVAEHDAVLMALQERTLSQTGQHKYLTFKWEELKVRREHGNVTAVVAGEVSVPFSTVEEWLGGQSWAVDAVFTKRDFQPTSWVRLLKRIVEESEND